jgi:hypothetical protein
MVKWAEGVLLQAIPIDRGGDRLGDRRHPQVERDQPHVAAGRRRQLTHAGPNRERRQIDHDRMRPPLPIHCLGLQSPEVANIAPGIRLAVGVNDFAIKAVARHA